MWVFTTERTASVAVATVRIRDRVKSRRCRAWRRRSRRGGEYGGLIPTCCLSSCAPHQRKSYASGLHNTPTAPCIPVPSPRRKFSPASHSCRRASVVMPWRSERRRADVPAGFHRHHRVDRHQPLASPLIRTKRQSIGLKYLVTGHAGFIGFHTARSLLRQGEAVVGFGVRS